MKLVVYQNNKIIDITQLCNNVTWSGDIQQVARKLEFNVVYPLNDNNIEKVNIALGNMVIFYEDNKELFRGIVFTKEKSSSSQAIRVTCYDHLIYLIKSKGTYNFKKMTAEQIAQKVAGDFGISIGSLAKTNISQNLIVQGEDIYSIIMKAYTNAFKQNGKKYIPIMRQGKLYVIEKGSTVVNYVLESNTNITDSSYTESIENMVNRVKIYDDKGNYINKVENADWIKLYGVLQDTYTKEEGKNALTVAKNMLKGIERSGDISALGNVDCITGYAIKVKEPYTNLVGLFYIDSDTHTWNNGQHTMQLSLHFENIMDEKSDS